MNNNPLLWLIILFVFLGNDDFDATQLLLALALFSTINENGELCCNTGNLVNPIVE